MKFLFRTLLVWGLVGSRFVYAQEDKMSILPLYPSLQGTSGGITAPGAYTLPAGHGYLSIQESFVLDSLDRVHLAIGITDRLEAGIRSDIPALQNPRFSFFLKFNVFRQDSIFKGFPAISLGMHRQASYIVASYRWTRVSLSGGYNKTITNRGPFANLSLQIVPALTLQADFSPLGTGIGLRGRYKRLWASLIFFQPRLENQRFEDYFWDVGYRWTSPTADPPIWK